MIKNKFLKNTAIVLAIISVFGSTLSSVSAMEVVQNRTAMTQYVDGVYELKTTLKHETEEKESAAHTYLKKSNIEILNGKIYMVMEFNSGNLIKEILPSINGKDVHVENTLNVETKIRTIKFEINSLKDEVKLNVKINPFGNFVVNAGCRVVYDEIEIPTVEAPSEEDSETPDDSKPSEEENDKVEEDATIETPSKPEDDKKDETTDSNSGSKPSNSTVDVTKNGYYQVKNIVHCDNPTGYAMVRNLLTETTNMEVKDGKTYMTLKMGGYDLMSKVVIKVNGKTANFDKKVLDSKTVEFTFEIPNLDSKVNMSMFINMLGSNVEYGVSFNKSSVKYISSNEKPSLPSAGSPVIPDKVIESNGTTSTTEDAKVENTAVKGKLYTVKNSVISDSETGREMTRKYLNSTTKIEEINGKYYATLTFTGVDLMNNHKIFVNGSLVNHTITSKTSSSVSIRFAIPSIDAIIKVQVHIVPVNRTVTFGVKLLKDTLTFVKDFEMENGSLPQTGAALSSEMMLAVGSLLTVSGALVRRKRK